MTHARMRKENETSPELRVESSRPLARLRDDVTNRVIQAVTPVLRLSLRSRIFLGLRNPRRHVSLLDVSRRVTASSTSPNALEPHKVTDLRETARFTHRALSQNTCSIRAETTRMDDPLGDGPSPKRLT